VKFCTNDPDVVYSLTSLRLAFVIQTCVPSEETAFGSLPGVTLEETVPVAAAIDDTVPLNSLATQTVEPSDDTPSGVEPTVIDFTTTGLTIEPGFVAMATDGKLGEVAEPSELHTPPNITAPSATTMNFFS